MTNKQFLEAVERYGLSPRGDFPLTPLGVKKAYHARPEREVEEILAAGVERRAAQEKLRREREEGDKG